MFNKIATKFRMIALSVLVFFSTIGSVHSGGGVTQQAIYLETVDKVKMYGVNIRPYMIYDKHTILALSSTSLKVEGKPVMVNYLEAQYGWTDKFESIQYMSYTSIAGIGYVTDRDGSRPYYMGYGSLGYTPFNWIGFNSYIRYRDVISDADYKFNSLLVGANGSLIFGKNVVTLDVANSYNDEQFTAYALSYTRRF